MKVNLSSLITSLRDTLSSGKFEHKDESLKNIKETMELASRKLLSRATNGEIELDVKDLKDLASVYSLLNQTDGGEDGMTGTPQAPSKMVQVFNNNLTVTNSPEGKPEINQADLENLSSDDVDKLVSDQFNTNNKSNYDESKEA